ncbi:MAG: (5-formylfuran-3-yl)methyl phosphate synthase, partial [Vulcanisaeta sp.]
MNTPGHVKLLISVRNVEEAVEALEGGADIIDVKDVSHGSLGLPRYGVVREVALKIGSAREKSVPIGDLERRDSAI